MSFEYQQTTNDLVLFSSLVRETLKTKSNPRALRALSEFGSLGALPRFALSWLRHWPEISWNLMETGTVLADISFYKPILNVSAVRNYKDADDDVWPLFFDSIRLQYHVVSFCLSSLLSSTPFLVTGRIPPRAVAPKPMFGSWPTHFLKMVSNAIRANDVFKEPNVDVYVLSKWSLVQSNFVRNCFSIRGWNDHWGPLCCRLARVLFQKFAHEYRKIYVIDFSILYVFP